MRRVLRPVLFAAFVLAIFGIGWLNGARHTFDSMQWTDMEVTEIPSGGV